MAKIYLDCADNARDIGGMVTADGTVISEHKLIRSNALYKASDADLELLTDKYNLKRIIDLRTELESSQRPDSVPDGVEYIHIPILTQEAIGITHNNSVMQDTAELLQSGKIKVDMCEMYRNMMSSPYSQAQFAKVMKLLLEDCGGATLWHCASGKDRCGMVSALIELALGVSKEDIMSDYMETAKVTSSQSETIWTGVFNRTKKCRAR